MKTLLVVFQCHKRVTLSGSVYSVFKVEFHCELKVVFLITEDSFDSALLVLLVDTLVEQLPVLVYWD